MNEENNISIDLDAEKFLVAPLLTEDEIKEEINYNIVNEQPLPESSFTEVQVNGFLPDAYVLGPTPTTENITSLLPQYSEILTQTSLKIDSETLYHKTVSIEKQVEQLGSALENMQNENKGSFMGKKEKDRFEERPYVIPTNLIFEQRMARMSSKPEWS